MDEISKARLQVQFICPKCGYHLAWSAESASIKCPLCRTWVTNENRRKEFDVYLPEDSDQTVLFADEEVEDANENVDEKL